MSYLMQSTWDCFDYDDGAERSVCRLNRQGNPAMKCGKIYWGREENQLQQHLDRCHPDQLDMGGRSSTPMATVGCQAEIDICSTPIASDTTLPQSDNEIFSTPKQSPNKSQLQTTSSTQTPIEQFLLDKSHLQSTSTTQAPVEQFLLHQLSQVFHHLELNPCGCQTCVGLVELLDCNNPHCSVEDQLDRGDSQQSLTRKEIPSKKPPVKVIDSRNRSSSKAAAILRMVQNSSSHKRNWIRPAPVKSSQRDQSDRFTVAPRANVAPPKAKRICLGYDSQSESTVAESSGDEYQPDHNFHSTDTEDQSIRAEVITVANCKSPTVWSRSKIRRADVDIVNTFQSVLTTSRLRVKGNSTPKPSTIVPSQKKSRLNSVAKSHKKRVKPAGIFSQSSSQSDTVGPPVLVSRSDQFPPESFAYGKQLVVLVEQLSPAKLAEWGQ